MRWHWVAVGWLMISLSCASEDDATGGVAGDSSAGESGAAGIGGQDAAPAGGTAGSAGSGASIGGGSSGTAGSSGGGSGGSSGSGAAAGSAGSTCTEKDVSPNDSESTATVLPPISDCDEEESTFVGTLSPGDVDWFSFAAVDAAFCSVNPAIGTVTSENVELCIFFECVNGSGAEVGCPAGSQDRESPQGRPGCCSTASMLEPDLNCNGTLDEEARAFIQVAWPGNSNCKDYEIAYHY